MAKILVIDDDAQLRAMLRQMLERDNHEVHELSTGVGAADVVTNDGIELILTDLLMPQKDGIMSIQELLMQHPRARIIAMSGGVGGNAAWLPIAKKAGAMQLLKKPFTRDQLLSTVSEVLADPWK